MKLEPVDWNGVGATDLNVCQPRHSTVAVTEESGLPWSHDHAGISVLLSENKGRDEEPVFAYPILMHHRGRAVHLGQHPRLPAVKFFGNERALAVGAETGRMIYYDRDEITWQQGVERRLAERTNQSLPPARSQLARN